jgi:hypothetical protein
MLMDFLENLEREVSSEISSIQEQLDLENAKLTEEEKFLGLIQEEHNEDFQDFSPRKYESVNDKTLHDTKNDIDSIKTHINSLNADLKIRKKQLYDINDCIKEAKKLSKSSQPKYVASKDSVITKLNLISSLISTDPMRAKIEISELLKEFK